MAELWKLPIIFVIENNGYAMGTAVSRSSSEDAALSPWRELPRARHAGRRHGRARGARRGRGGAQDGCVAGKGPIVMELKTYRYRGHSMSDPAKYRTKEEVSR